MSRLDAEVSVPSRVQPRPRSVSLVGITLAALPFALSLDRIMNGLTRPIAGWISDRVGREPTMTVMFGLQAVTIAVAGGAK